ncbi:MAG: sugar transferase [Acholeplasma sp.]|nr:sugar transferase [Acholeplasma sp.]
MRKRGLYETFFKRMFDLIVSIVALILLGPLLLFISCLVCINYGFPVIFVQERPGYQEKIFKLYKFRSMTNEKNQHGELLHDDKRLKTFGKFLRSTSLDELPSLINIIKGELSIVGPRPQLVKDMVFMSKEQRMRHLTRPGLTGLAQISGRNSISWEEKLNYDLNYLSDIKFSKDIRIILKTVFKVLKRDGISQKGTETGLDYGDYLLQNNKINLEYYNLKMREADAILSKCCKL